MDEQKVKKLKELNYLLLNCRSIDEGLELVTNKLKDIIEVDRVSIFIYSKTSNMLWTYLADGVEKLIIPADKGIVGYAVKHKTIKKVNDTSKEKLFYKEVDEMTGYKTKNILAVPLLNDDNDVIGVVELMNKKDKFNQKDLNIAYLFSQYISTPLLNMLKHRKLEVKKENDDFI